MVSRVKPSTDRAKAPSDRVKEKNGFADLPDPRASEDLFEVTGASAVRVALNSVRSDVLMSCRVPGAFAAPAVLRSPDAKEWRHGPKACRPNKVCPTGTSAASSKFGPAIHRLIVEAAAVAARRGS